MATAFGMKGNVQRTRASPYLVSDARRAILQIGKGNIAYHIRTVVKEMESYNQTREEKRILYNRIMKVADKITALDQRPGGVELERLWAEWDKGL